MNTQDVKDLIRTKNGILENLSFNNVHWNFDDKPESNLVNNSIQFINCKFEGRVLIENLNNEKCSISFKQCLFLDDKNLDKKTNQLIFRNSTFEILSFSKSSLKSIELNQIKTKYFFIIDSSIDYNLDILDCNISDVSIKTISDQNFSFGKLRIESPELYRFSLNTKCDVKKLQIFELQNAYIDANIDNISICSNDFKLIEFSPENISERLKINEFTLIESNFSGMLTLENLEIDKFSLNNSTSNNGTLKLNEVIIKNSGLYDTTISKMYWHQVHFIEQLNIERCDLSGLKMSFVKWLDGHKLSNSFIKDKIPWFYPLRSDIEKYTTDEIMYLQYERDTYRQLKAASFANQNLPEALAFYRNEMRLYWKEIRINGGVNWQDRILVCLNRWVSDFGQSWGLPLMWLAIFHTLLYFCIIDFNFTLDWNAFKSGGGQFFELLNPVHKTPEYIKGFYIGIELLMRILDGFFIYHFIRATRKFAKI